MSHIKHCIIVWWYEILLYLHTDYLHTCSFHIKDRSRSFINNTFINQNMGSLVEWGHVQNHCSASGPTLAHLLQELFDTKEIPKRLPNLRTWRAYFLQSKSLRLSWVQNYLLWGSEVRRQWRHVYRDFWSRKKTTSKEWGLYKPWIDFCWRVIIFCEGGGGTFRFPPVDWKPSWHSQRTGVHGDLPLKPREK